MSLNQERGTRVAFNEHVQFTSGLHPLGAGRGFQGRARGGGGAVFFGFCGHI